MAETTRRNLLIMTGGTLLMAADKDQLAWEFNFPSIDGGTLSFSEFKGRVLLVANTASSAATPTSMRAWKSFPQ